MSRTDGEMSWWRRARAARSWLLFGLVLVSCIGGAFTAGAATMAEKERLAQLPAKVAQEKARNDVQDSLLALMPSADSVALNRHLIGVVLDSVRSLSSQTQEIRCYVREMALKRDPIRSCSEMLRWRR